MSKNIDDVIKEVMKSNKEIHNVDSHISKDIAELKKSIKALETKLTRMDESIKKTFDTLQEMVVMLYEVGEAEMDHEDDDEVEDWTPYNEDNFDYEDSYEDNDEEEL